MFGREDVRQRDEICGLGPGDAGLVELPLRAELVRYFFGGFHNQGDESSVPV